MTALQNTILSYFHDQGWPVQHHETEPLIRLEYGNEVGNWSCLIWYRAETSQVLVYSIMPAKIPADQRVAVAEFMMRINYDQVLGGFEINMEDGEVRYRTALDFGSEVFTPGLFDPVVKANLIGYGDHLEGMEAVIAGDATPKEAVDKILAEQPDLDLRD